MYEPYPVPELAREHQQFRYSSLWTFAKQDLRLLMFFLLIASLIGFGVGYFWSCIFVAFVVFFLLLAYIDAVVAQGRLEYRQGYRLVAGIQRDLVEIGHGVRSSVG